MWAVQSEQIKAFAAGKCTGKQRFVFDLAAAESVLCGSVCKFGECGRRVTVWYKYTAAGTRSWSDFSSRKEIPTMGETAGVRRVFKKEARSRTFQDVVCAYRYSY